MPLVAAIMRYSGEASDRAQHRSSAPHFANPDAIVHASFWRDGIALLRGVSIRLSSLNDRSQVPDPNHHRLRRTDDSRLYLDMMVRSVVEQHLARSANGTKRKSHRCLVL